MIIIPKQKCRDSVDSTPLSIKVDQALEGLISVDSLTGDEQEEYFERFDALLSAPSLIAEAFFKDQREHVGGFGMDETGNIVYVAPTKPDSM